MYRKLQLAAVLLITATTARAQFHLPQHNQKKSDKEDIAWLAPYATPEPDGSQTALVHDTRFKMFVRDHLTAPQRFWNDNESLADTIFEFLGTPGKVVLAENRFLSIDGCVPEFCPSRGLLFVDLGVDHPLVAFVALDWTKENKTPGQSGAEYTLWVFTNRPIISDSIPSALTQAIPRWIDNPPDGSITPPNVTTAVIVDPNGTPHQVAPSTFGVKPATPSKAKP